MRPATRAALVAGIAAALGCGSSTETRPTCLPEVSPVAAAAGRVRSAALPYPAPGAYRIAVDPTSADPAALEAYVLRVVRERHAPFDWALADDATLCAAVRAAGAPAVVGARGSLETLEAALDDATVVSRNERLRVARVAETDCAKLATIRSLDAVAFVETGVPIALDRVTTAVDEPGPAPSSDAQLNPGRYDPAGPYASYAFFLDEIDRDASAGMRRQNMTPVYDDLGRFGTPDIGVAVIDNGVLPQDIAFLSTGRGTYRTAGTLEQTEPPIVSPQPGDWLGIAATIPSAFNHGSRQSKHVHQFAPHADRMTVRASSFPFLVLPSDFAGVTRAIDALADDDEVQIVSMSLGTVIRSTEMERAIERFHGAGKILIAAGGTSLPVLKDLLGIVFPATLPTTVSATGLADTEETGGVFQLGSASHGGPENDFVIEPSGSSSEAVSRLAGMIATLWAIDPAQPRESILDALVRSSDFYRERGEKDPLFGWGRIDGLDAARRIERGGCVVAGSSAPAG